MCGGRRSTNVEVKVPTPAPPPIAPPPSIPEMPRQQVAPPENVQIKKIDQVGVQPDRQRRQRERTAMRRGTSSLRIPLNTGMGTSSGGLNT